jgi:hypothetical protein
VGNEVRLDEAGIQESQFKVASLMNFQFPTKQLARYKAKPGEST